MSKPVLYLFNGKIGRVGNVLLSKQETPQPPDYVQIGDQIWKNSNLAFDDGGEGIFISNGNYFYSVAALNRINASLQGTGWHVPSKDEFITLGCYISGSSDRTKTTYKGANTLKSTTGWNGGHNGTNSTGFNAIPIGFCEKWNTISLYGETKDAKFWSSTAGGGGSVWNLGLEEDDYASTSQVGWPDQAYYSIRLIKDS